MKAISVLMPCLNPGQHLNEAIASALAQPELSELIIADGGSNQETIEHIKTWGIRAERIKWFSAPDHGPADGLNKALSIAEGEWIGWLNADDTYQPGALGRALDTIRRCPDLLMVYGHGQHIDSAGEFVEFYPSKPPEVGLEKFQQGCFICQPTVLLGKQLLKKSVDSMLNTTLHSILNYVRIFNHTSIEEKIKFIESVQASTRLHKDTITSRHQWEINLECAQLLKDALGEADQHWIDTAAAAYVCNQPPLYDNNKTGDIFRRVTLDEDIKGKFEEACQLLYIDQGHAMAEQVIRCSLPEILQLMLIARPDLRRLQFDKSEKERTFCQWLLANGTNEYQEIFDCTQTLSSLYDWLLKSNKNNSLCRIVQAIWDNHPDHQKIFKGKKRKRSYQQWLKNNWDSLNLGLPGYSAIFERRKRRKILRWIKNKIHQKQNPERKRQGINLVGYATYALGIGEDLRTCFHAFQAQEIETKIIDFKPGGDLLGRRELSLEQQIEARRDIEDFKTTLICLTAEETIRWAMSRNYCNKADESYTIGYWPWELPNWPKNMLKAVDIVDEIWVSSKYIAQDLKKQTKKPIKVMPLCAEPPGFEVKPLSKHEREQTRALFNLAQESTLFCFSFDLSSYIARKNPWGCVKAFHTAFPPQLANGDRDDVGLVIKTFAPKTPNSDWEQLKELCKLDRRIRLMESNLTRYQLLQLYGCCDGFLSMHRAEGFGRGMAEALQLGLDVVATD